MNDTSPKIQKIYREMLMKRGNEERLFMGFSMFETCKELMIAGIKHYHPHISESDLRKEVFRRMYQRDLPPKFLANILSKI